MIEPRPLLCLTWPEALAPTPPRRAHRQALLAAWHKRRPAAVLATLDAAPVAPLPAASAAWAAEIRRAGLTPAVALPTDGLDEQVLEHLATAGPLLVVLRPPHGEGMQAWRAARLRLAHGRQPLLRFARQGGADCHVAPFQPDVVLAAAAAGPSPDPRCQACARVATCPGPAPGDDVQPFPIAVSNQFDLVAIAAAVGADSTSGSGCEPGLRPRHATFGADAAPAVSGSGSGCEPGLRPRHATFGADAAPAVSGPGFGSPVLWLQSSSGLQPFAPAARDLAPAELDLAVARGQLYLDVSTKARLDDFAADLRLLEPVPGARHAGVPVWRARPEQPFAAEEALLRAELARLRGTVVDVGAGPVRYLAELRQALRDGTLRYLAVEPDREALLRCREALPEGTWLQGTGEHLPIGDGAADAVLMLRSFNHLRDVDRALREAARVLRPAGTLLLIDNVAFGLLRTPEQLARAHAVPVTATPFEHFRNADGAQAVAALRRVLGERVRIERCEDVAPGRSNQWLVLARVLGN